MSRLILLLFLFLFAHQTWAYNGAVSSATANTGIAAPELSDAPYINPALVPFGVGYNFAGSYSQLLTQPSSQVYAAALSDETVDSLFPASLGFTNTQFGTENDKDFRLSGAHFLFNKKLSLGLGVEYLNNTLDSANYYQTNGFLGGLWVVTKKIALGFAVNNILGNSNSQNVPTNLQQTRSGGLGFAYEYTTLVRFRVDLLTNSAFSLTTPTIAAGIENYYNEFFILRLGAQRNTELATNLFSAGLGFAGPKFGLHYAFQVSPNNVNYSRHTVDLTVPLW